MPPIHFWGNSSSISNQFLAYSALFKGPQASRDLGLPGPLLVQKSDGMEALKLAKKGQDSRSGKFKTDVCQCYA